jgi:hypothetical protein
LDPIARDDRVAFGLVVYVANAVGQDLIILLDVANAAVVTVKGVPTGFVQPDKIPSGGGVLVNHLSHPHWRIVDFDGLVVDHREFDYLCDGSRIFESEHVHVGRCGSLGGHDLV